MYSVYIKKALVGGIKKSKSVMTWYTSSIVARSNTSFFKSIIFPVVLRNFRNTNEITVEKYEQIIELS